MIFPLLTFAQTKSEAKYSSKAIALQKKAVEIQFSTTGTKKEIYTKMLKTLDSAITIEPNYALAYRTKIIPLIKLEKYDQALLTLSKVRVIDPSNLKDIIKQGIVFEGYLNKPQDAKKCYKQAYDLAVKKKNNKINLFSEQAITYCLIFHKGQDSALLYLSQVIKNSMDKKSITQLKQLEKLIKSSVLDINKKKEMLYSNTQI